MHSRPVFSYINEKVIEKLAEDLRHPPKDFPEFDMSDPSADMGAYIVARHLGVDAIDKYDTYHMAQTLAVMNDFEARCLIRPRDLVELEYPLERVTNIEAAELVESFIERNYYTPDYMPLVLGFYNVSPEEDEDFDATYSETGIVIKVEQFLRRYGDKPKA